MARSEARIYTEIWEDDDFLALESAGQRLYMFLLSQPDLAHSGVIPLRERRWARKSKNGSVAEIELGLGQLETHFLVVDWDTEEVLVRSLLRRDRIFRQPNVLRAATDHVPLIESVKILEALAAEIERIRAENPVLTEHQEIAMVEIESALVKRLKGLGGWQPDKGSENPSGNPTPEVPGVRGETTVVTTDSPYPDPRNPGTTSGASLPASSARKRGSKRSGRIPDDFEPTAEMIAAIRTTCPDVDIQFETVQFVDHWKAASDAKGIKKDWDAAWRTWMRNQQKWSSERRARASPNSDSPTFLPFDPEDM